MSADQTAGEGIFSPCCNGIRVQLNEQENRLDAIRKEAKQLETQIDAGRAAVDKAIQGLSFDDRL